MSKCQDLDSDSTGQHVIKSHPALYFERRKKVMTLTSADSYIMNVAVITLLVDTIK